MKKPLSWTPQAFPNPTPVLLPQDSLPLEKEITHSFLQMFPVRPQKPGGGEDTTGPEEEGEIGGLMRLLLKYTPDFTGRPRNA